MTKTANQKKFTNAHTRKGKMNQIMMAPSSFEAKTCETQKEYLIFIYEVKYFQTWIILDTLNSTPLAAFFNNVIRLSLKKEHKSTTTQLAGTTYET